MTTSGSDGVRVVPAGTPVVAADGNRLRSTDCVSGADTGTAVVVVVMIVVSGATGVVVVGATAVVGATVVVVAVVVGAAVVELAVVVGVEVVGDAIVDVEVVAGSEIVGAAVLVGSAVVETGRVVETATLVGATVLDVSSEVVLVGDDELDEELVEVGSAAFVTAASVVFSEESTVGVASTRRWASSAVAGPGSSALQAAARTTSATQIATRRSHRRG